MKCFIALSPRKISKCISKPCRGVCHESLIRGLVEVLYYIMFGVGGGFASFWYYTHGKSLPFRGSGGTVAGDNFDISKLGYPNVAGLTTILSMLGAALSFLLVFRLSWSYSNWWDARGSVGTVYAKSKALMVMFVTNSLSVVADDAALSGTNQEKALSREEKAVIVHRAKFALKFYSAALTMELTFGEHNAEHIAEENTPVPPKDEAEQDFADKLILDNTSDDDSGTLTPRPAFKKCEHRVFVAHALLSRVVHDAARVKFFHMSEALVAQQQLADLMELYHRLMKVKQTKMPTPVHLLVGLMKGTFCLFLYPQLLAYAFVMGLDENQREKEAMRRSNVFPALYLTLTTIGIIYFVTMGFIAKELDDPFGDDMSDFKLVKWTRKLFRDLDNMSIKHLYGTKSEGDIPQGGAAASQDGSLGQSTQEETKAPHSSFEIDANEQHAEGGPRTSGPSNE